MDMTPPKRLLPLMVLCQMLFAPTASAQAKVNRARTDHALTITTLSKQLRWHDEAGLNQYKSEKDARTNRLLSEVDGFISETFEPGTATADQVRQGLDTILGRRQGELVHNMAFSASLPGGHFLIAAVELERGGPAVAEDAVSIRAYRAAGNKFVLAASTDLHSSDPTNPSLSNLHVRPLTPPPSNGEFWVLAWADIPPHAPPTIALRLLAFDGEKFQTKWTPDDIIAESVEKAVHLTLDGGFVIRRLPEWNSPVVINEQYVLMTNGPQKLTEWKSERE